MICCRQNHGQTSKAVAKVFDESGIAAKTQIWALTREIDTG
jgi:hypothetical protein